MLNYEHGFSIPIDLPKQKFKEQRLLTLDIEFPMQINLIRHKFNANRVAKSRHIDLPIQINCPCIFTMQEGCYFWESNMANARLHLTFTIIQCKFGINITQSCNIRMSLQFMQFTI